MKNQYFTIKPPDHIMIKSSGNIIKTPINRISPEKFFSYGNMINSNAWNECFMCEIAQEFIFCDTCVQKLYADYFTSFKYDKSMPAPFFITILENDFK